METPLPNTACPHCQAPKTPMQSYCDTCRAAYQRARRHIRRLSQAPPPPKPDRTCPQCNSSLPAPAFPTRSPICRNCKAINRAHIPSNAGRPPLPIDPLTDEFIRILKRRTAQ